MENRNEGEEVMLPGFRFHPTDEELVGFYLTMKIQQKPLSIELIKQIDIYKYDPWDLPKLATNGEKEWYFYCPRDRKYRNSTRPNRVTGAGFWKATGTDRPIYSCQSSKCIGLKKSLVFYKGKAAKGIKTDWMMHEFRLPSLSDSVSSNKYLDKNVPANEAWAICRIFKKANSSTRRVLSHSCFSPILDITKSDINMSPISSFSPQHFPAYHMENRTWPYEDHLNPSYTCSTTETSKQASRSVINDASSLLQEMSTSILGDFGKASEIMDLSMFDDKFNSLSATTTEDMQENLGHGEEGVLLKGQNVGQIDDLWGCTVRSMEVPLSLADAWRSNLLWDSSPSDPWRSNLLWDSSPFPSELSTSYSTNKCYT